MATEALERRGTLLPVRHGLLAFREDDLPQAVPHPEAGQVTVRSIALDGLTCRYVTVDVLWADAAEVKGVTAMFYTDDSQPVVDVLQIPPDAVAEDMCFLTQVPKALAIRHERDVLNGRDVALPGTPIQDPNSIHDIFWTLTKALRTAPQK